MLIEPLFLSVKNCNIQGELSVYNVFYDLKLYIVKRNGYFYPHLGVKYDIRNPLPSLLETSDQPSWVKEFRKAVKASTPKGWLVMKGRKESTRVQIRKDGKKIADLYGLDMSDLDMSKIEKLTKEQNTPKCESTD